MPTNDFLPFATGAGANVESQAVWITDPQVTTGFVIGIANPGQANKAWRQSSSVVKAITDQMANVLDQNVLDNGVTNTLWSQFLQTLLQSDTFTDTGSANALVVAAPFGLTFPAPATGLTVKVIAAFGNTGSVTFNWAGTGLEAVVYSDGSALLSGDYTAGAVLNLCFNGTSWELISFPITALRQHTLVPLPVGGLTVYVRTDGSNSNNGSANTSGSAFATIDGAITAISALYNLSGNRQLTIIIGLAGSYAPPTTVPVGSNINLEGLTSTASNYIIFGGSQDIIAAVDAEITITNVEIQNTNTTHNWATASESGVLTVNNVLFTQTAGANSFSIVVAFPGGTVNVNQATFNAVSAASSFVASGGGVLNIEASATVTYTGTSTFSSATAWSEQLGYMNIAPGITLTNSGTVNGSRYLSSYNAIINSGGGGATLFPGTSSGTTSNGGLYI